MHPAQSIQTLSKDYEEAAEGPDPTGVFYCIFFGGNRIPRVLYHSGEIGCVDAQAIRAREIGDRLWLGPKITGMFTLQDVPPNKNVVMVATGHGVGALYEYVADLFCEKTQSGVLWCCMGRRHSWDLGYRSELEMMQDLCANFIYIPQISRPANEHVAWSGHTG